MVPKYSINGIVRDMKIKWLRKHRESVQYLSVVPRPQRVRMMWMNDLGKGKV